MEDIPRELERELIAGSRPRPVKRPRKWELLLLADTGEIKPVRHIRGLVILFVAIFVVSVAGSCGIYYYSRGVAQENKTLKETIAGLTIQEKRLRREIDSLVSRYMMESVAESRGEGKEGTKAPVSSGNNKGKEPPRKKPPAPEKKRSGKEFAPPKAHTAAAKPVLAPAPSAELAGNIDNNPSSDKREPAENKTDPSENKAELFDVAVDKFELSRQMDENSLKVKFIIRNRGKSPQNISGRIFVLLKPDDMEQDNWLISPETELVGGKPKDAVLGQFFSINRYKTVRLTLSSDRPVEYYKQCTVFVYNEGGSTILEKEFPL